MLSFAGDDPHRPVLPHDGRVLQWGQHGGWGTFKASESSTIATALDGVGYRTALIGKYLNGYVGDGIYVPPGWDRWFAFAGTNASYYNYKMFDDRRGPGLVSFGSRPWHYSTDVIRHKAVAFIRNSPKGTPLFLMATPYAPHGNFTAAPRHDGDLSAMPVRLGPAVNEADMSDKPSYLRGRPQIGLSRLRVRTRDQWETLLAVDEMVSQIVRALRDTGRANNTLFIFTSDNGVVNYEHRWEGKLIPHEESIRSPWSSASRARSPRERSPDRSSRTSTSRPRSQTSPAPRSRATASRCDRC